MVLSVGAGKLKQTEEGHVGEFFFPLILYPLAERIGKLREQRSGQSPSRQSERTLLNGEEWARRGETWNTLGVLGELAGLHYCTVFEVPYTNFNLSIGVAREPDCILWGNYRVNIKAIRPDAPDLLVSRSAFRSKGEECDGYWFMRFSEQRGRVQHFHYSTQTVSTWPIKNVRYSDAAYCPIQSIQLIGV